MFRTERFVKWPWRWYAFEAWARVRRCAWRRFNHRSETQARAREERLSAMIEDAQVCADRRALRRVLEALEDAGYYRPRH